MSILKLPDIVYPLAHVNKTNEIIDVLNDNLNMYYSEENPLLTPVEGVCTWTVTHNLGTTNINYSIYEGSNSIIADVSIVSENAITITLNSATNIAAKTYSIVVISNGAGSSSGGITVDVALSATSENPVQNKVITNDIYYKTGDVESYISEMDQALWLSALLSYGATRLYFNIVLPKKIPSDLTTITCSSLKAIVRTNLGKYPFTTNYTNFKDNITSIKKVKDNVLCLIITLDSAISSSDATNNTLQCIEIGESSFSFS